MAREMTEICTSSQLPLGAKGICVERPLMTAIKQDPELCSPANFSRSVKWALNGSQTRGLSSSVRAASSVSLPAKISSVKP